MAREVLVQKVGVGSLGKIVGTVHAIIGVFIGMMVAVVASISVIANNDIPVVGDIFVAIGISLLALIFYPVLSFAIGWLYGALVALVMNIVFGFSGGLDLTIEDADLVIKK